MKIEGFDKGARLIAKVMQAVPKCMEFSLHRFVLERIGIRR